MAALSKLVSWRVDSVRYMHTAIRCLAYFLAGISFWIPSAIIHAVRGSNFGASWVDIAAITILPLVSSGIVTEFIHRWRPLAARRGVIALWMLLGIWFFGPVYMMFGSAFIWGGFATPWQVLFLAVVLFPLTTFSFSVYDGTFFALIIVTFWFIITGVVGLLRVKPSATATD